jgi:hypothetical protein
MPTFARRPGTGGAATEDRNAEDRNTEDRNDDNRAEERNERPTTDARAVNVRPQVDDRGPRHAAGATATTAGPATTTTTDDVETRRVRAQKATADRAATERAADQAEADRLATERERERAEADRAATERAPARKARASVLATLGLVVGVAAALSVLTGVLAGYGLALGVVGLLLSLGGLSATGRRHVAGKSDAVLGVVLSVGAMIVGALALTGALSWLTTETDKVEQLRQWLDAQFVDRF